MLRTQLMSEDETTTPYNVRFDKRTMAMVRDLARHWNVSRANIIRMAIKRWFDESRPQKVKKCPTGEQ